MRVYVPRFSKDLLLFVAFGGLILPASNELLAQDQPVPPTIFNQPQPEDVPHFSARVTNISSDTDGEGSLLVELGFVNDALQFVKEKKMFRADFEVELTLQDSLNTEVSTEKWQGSVFSSSFKNTYSNEIYTSTLGKIEAVPGAYQLVVKLKDAETGQIAEQTGQVVVAESPVDSFSISSVFFMSGELLARTYWLHGDDYEIEFARDSSYAIFEAYNLNDADTLTASFSVVPGQGTIADSGTVKLVGNDGISRGFIALDTRAFSGPGQTFKLEARYHSSVIKVELPIRVSPGRQGPIYTNLASAIEKLVYIAGKKELELLDSLKGDEQVAEFEAFWERRDPTPETNENEYKTEFYRRIAVANERFRIHEDGWRTEMGRVFVMLGPPQYVDQPNRDSFSTGFGSRELIVWVYTRYQRRVIFERVGPDYRIKNYGEIFDLIGDEMRL